MLKECCHCGQTLPETGGHGIKLTGVGLIIADATRKAGKHGIEAERLFDIIYADDPDGGPSTGHGCMHVHIVRLNRLLKSVGKEVRSGQCGPGILGHYFYRDIK